MNIRILKIENITNRDIFVDDSFGTTLLRSGDSRNIGFLCSLNDPIAQKGVIKQRDAGCIKVHWSKLQPYNDPIPYLSTEPPPPPPPQKDPIYPTLSQEIASLLE